MAFITFVDDYSRYAKTYCIKSKNESGVAFEKYITSIRNLLGFNGKIFYVRIDRGTEYIGGSFLEIMEREKTELDPSPPYTPQLNGLAERINRTIQNKVRSLMCDSGIPSSMWELAVAASVHIGIGLS